MRRGPKGPRQPRGGGGALNGCVCGGGGGGAELSHCATARPECGPCRRDFTGSRVRGERSVTSAFFM